MPISIDRRLLLSSVFALAALPRTALAQQDLTDPASIQTHVEGLVHEFLNRMPDDRNYAAPSVRVAFTPGLSWISSTKPHVMHVAAWEQCPPPVQAFFVAVQGEGQDEGQGERKDAAEFYRAGFYNFLIPHEMSHFIDYERRQGPTSEQRYESELKANRVAVAFWMERSGGPDWLSRFIPRVEAALAKLPVPVPAGEEPMAYFNTSYQALMANPAAYAWFQWQMVLEAWGRRHEAGFATLLKDTLKTSDL